MTSRLPKLGMDGVLCARLQPGCVVGKNIYARDNISNTTKKETKMKATFDGGKYGRLFGTSAANRYWARCMGRGIAADASMDDMTTEKLKAFLQSKLHPADHAAACALMDGGEESLPDNGEAEDDLPENAVERSPESKRGSAGVTTDAASF